MKTVLLVSFLFPPTNNIGAVRIGKFAKYLPDFGWEPVVLTVDDVGRYPQTLPVEVRESTVVRTWYPKLRLPWAHGGDHAKGGESSVDRPVSTPSGLLTSTLQRPLRFFYTLPLTQALLSSPTGWYLPGLRRALHITRERPVDAILTTYDPATPHMIGSALSRRTGTPWVADYRDPWTQSAYLRRRWQPMQFFEEQLERRLVRRSSLITATSDPIAGRLERFHSRKVIVIRNGFDDDDFRDEAPPLTSKFTVTYVGNLYDRDLAPLLGAVRSLLDNGTISAEAFELRFLGNDVWRRLPGLIQKHGVGDVVKAYPAVSFKESLRKQRESTVLLLLGWCDERDRGILPGKLFEYLGSSRPILGVTLERDEIAGVLERTGAGIIASTGMAIRAQLAAWFAEYSAGGKVTSGYAPDADAIGSYSRREQARRLSQVLEEAVEASAMENG